MENRGKLHELMAPSHNKADEFLSEAPQHYYTDACHIEGPHEVEESPLKNMVANCSSHNNEESACLTSTSVKGPELAHDDDDDELGSVKRQRVENEAGSSSASKATESSILNFIQENDEGVSKKRALNVDMMKLVYTFLSFAHSNVSMSIILLQVSLSHILEYFDGSEAGAVIDLLSCLEGEFVIFKKNDRYRLL